MGSAPRFINLSFPLKLQGAPRIYFVGLNFSAVLMSDFFYPQPQTKEELQQWLIDFFLGSSMEIRSIRGIPAVLRICMIGRRWCSINRSVSGKLNWQLVANKQCYEYV